MKSLKCLMVLIFLINSNVSSGQGFLPYKGFGTVYLDRKDQLPTCNSPNLGRLFFVSSGRHETYYFCGADLKWLELSYEEFPGGGNQMMIACGTKFQNEQGQSIYIELLRSLRRDGSFVDHCLIGKSGQEQGKASYFSTTRDYRNSEKTYGCRFNDEYYTYLTPEELASGVYTDPRIIKGNIHFIPRGICNYTVNQKDYPLIPIVVPIAPNGAQ